MNRILILLVLIILSNACMADSQENQNSNNSGQINKPKLPLEDIKLPAGFEIDIYGKADNARSLSLGSKGTVFAGNRSGNSVYALRDEDGDNYAEKVFVVYDKFKDSPNGVAFKDGNLYVAEISKIWVFRDIENNLSNPPKPELIYGGYPTDGHHGWKYIAFGPDDLLYVPVGAPCNICKSENPIYASITRMDVSNAKPEIFAEGIRNTVGFTWHPETKELWFTDNGRDWLGDDEPPCELNHAPKKGLHFGYPYCHGGVIADPEFGDKRPCSDFKKPAQNLGPHVAPLGLKFYTGNMFPQVYKNQILIAEHGSWNRSTPIGYRITMVSLDGDRSLGYSDFASGWLQEDGTAWGRPVDVLVMPDGAVLVSDDKAGVIYRITYIN
ncbi:sorbosone dehydrogenase family protein [Hyphobacterium sp. CCMP332]|nr:sorbosone dehydrogenase family protein [Hyphobacterium sp. CCMP332]